MIEDNDADAALLEILLSQVSETRYEPLHAPTLQQGLDRGRDGAQVVLLDLYLPDAHGAATLARSVAALGTLPVVVMSGLEGPVVAAQIAASGARAWIPKSRFSPAALHEVLQRALAG